MFNITTTNRARTKILREIYHSEFFRLQTLYREADQVVLNAPDVHQFTFDATTRFNAALHKREVILNQFHALVELIERSNTGKYKIFTCQECAIDAFLGITADHRFHLQEAS